MSIQYTVPGFEPMTSWTWIVSHYHLIRPPALFCVLHFVVIKWHWQKKIVFVFFDKLWPFDMRSFKPEIVRYCCQPNCPLTYDRILMAMTSRVLLLSTDVRVSTFNNKLCRCIKICGNSTQITCYFKKATNVTFYQINPWIKMGQRGFIFLSSYFLSRCFANQV